MEKNEVTFMKNLKNSFGQIADNKPEKCLTFSPNWFNSEIIL